MLPEYQHVTVVVDWAINSDMSGASEFQAPCIVLYIKQ